MNVTRAAIEKNRITTALLILLLVSGGITYMNMPRAEDPGFVVRTAVVMTFFPGASPERVELLVTDKIEKVVQEIPELDYVTSQSTTGTSIVWAEIQPRYKEMRPIWDDLRRKVERAAPDLPEGIIGPVVNDEFGDVFGTIIALTGEGYSYADLKDVADDVRDELLSIDEVAKVEIFGEQDERVFVEMGYCLKSTAHYMLWSWRFRLLSSVAAWTIPVRGWSWTSSSPTMRHAWSTWRVCAGRKGLCAWAVAGWERSGEHRGGVSSAHTVEGRPRCWREPCSTARARPCVCGFSLPGSSRARNTEPMLSGSSACSDWEATRQRGSGSTSSAGPWSDRIATS